MKTVNIRLFAVLAFSIGLLSACFDVTSRKNSTDFTSCLNSGGKVLESYPRGCVIGEQSFTEIAAETAAFEVTKMVLTVGPKTATCQGSQALDQQCLIVDGEYFYESIIGFEHEPGITVTIEVERRQICDPQVINSCPQDVSIYRYELLNKLAQEGAPATDKLEVFIGEVININAGKDGYTVALKSQYSPEVLNAVISHTNLGQNSEFDFADIVLGNWLKVTGEQFSLGQQSQMAARSAMSYHKVAIAERTATGLERQACSLAGGDIRQVGKLQAEQCVQPYPDAAKYCLSSQDCFGRCLVDTNDHRSDSLARNAKVAGACQVTSHSFGCKALVENGRYVGTLCID